MCGIIGFTCLPAPYKQHQVGKLVEKLLVLSESRGKEATGIAINNGHIIRYIKAPLPASTLIRTNVFHKEINYGIQSDSHFGLIGHSRLVTDGAEHDNKNNQPVCSGRAIAVHNGIIVNKEKIWKDNPEIFPVTDLDSEIIPAFIDLFSQKGYTLGATIPFLFEQIKGMTSTAILMADRPALVLATNNGSLYYVQNKDGLSWMFASEKFILESTIKEFKNLGFDLNNIKQLSPGTFGIINLQTLTAEFGIFDNQSDAQRIDVSKYLAKLKIQEIANTELTSKHTAINRSLVSKFDQVAIHLEKEVNKRRILINEIKRCSKCILPDSFPFIEFDELGVCNYCKNYKPIERKSKEELGELLSKAIIKSENKYDCLVPFSGGRDSSYLLHYVKKELGLNPLAFSYDWGMLTDIGRRNQSIMCGELGVEHVLISADIRKKRRNINLNVNAWLNRPNLGTIPLFMAGDKQYFHYTNLLLKQNKLNLSIMGENMLETTMFKTGFCGVQPQFNGEHTYTLNLPDKIKMLFFYGKEFILNPAYINKSLFDTFDSFRSYYMIKHENLNLFDYLFWEEDHINKTIKDLYGWETDQETPTTWRIGDGTAAFYNYIYYMIAGFTENDTFRSNQIREGQLTREEAIRKVNEENRIRWDSIRWYCNAINVDFNNTIKIINSAKSIFNN